MEKDRRKLCFVVMGFGKKTDYESGRTLDLDKTYEGIIRPAALTAGVRPIRGDEVLRSGIIDHEMYEMLLRADLVLADISTANPNAIYELGVRHALRPKSTIIIKEDQGRYFFDLDHSLIFQYRHLGEDIGHAEAIRAQGDLTELIKSVLSNEVIDSPVYTYLPYLKQPQYSEEQFSDMVDELEAKEVYISAMAADGENAISQNDFGSAFDAFSKAHVLRPSDSHFIQRMVLARYKSKRPSEFSALADALGLLEKLNPGQSNDPETLGLSGAVHKRMWSITGDRPQLDLAINYYYKGFEVRRDYYTGENAALCFDIRAGLQVESDEGIYDRLSAKKIRESLSVILNEIISGRDFQDRPDQKWIWATSANISFALGDGAQASIAENAFRKLGPADWEIETFEVARSKLKEFGFGPN